MATITGTNTEKTDQQTQLFLAQQAQIRLIQWLGGVLIPLLIAFVAWLVITVNSAKLETVTLQGDLKVLEKTSVQRFDQVEKRFDQIEKALSRIEARLDKIEERLSTLEKAKAKD